MVWVRAELAATDLMIETEFQLKLQAIPEPTLLICGLITTTDFVSTKAPLMNN